jgi:hypothetical protein
VFFDGTKIKIATLIHFDTINKTINTKHFNKLGKLIMELHATYSNRKNYNPAFIHVKNIIYLKAFQNDSLIYETKGFKTSLLIKYKNPKTKQHFEKRVFYREGNTKMKKWVIRILIFMKMELSNQFAIHILLWKQTKKATKFTHVYTCRKFDLNGCIIKDE